MLPIPKEHAPCACGCGRYTINPTKEYLPGHRPVTAEDRIKISEGMKGRKLTWEHRKHVSSGLCNRDKSKDKPRKKPKPFPPRSLEHRKKISESNTGRHPSKKTRLKMSIANKNRIHNPTSEETKLKQSIAHKKLHAENPEKLHKAFIASQTDESIIKRRKNEKVKPNKLELAVKEFLDTYFPNSWKYTGDWGLILERKIPDFVNTDNNKIIEVFGDYWHKPEEEHTRATIFAKYGYKTLVIWQRDFNNKDKVKMMITEFMNIC